MEDKEPVFTLNGIDTAYKKLMHAKNLSQKGEKAKSEKIYKELISQYPQYFAAHRGLATLYIEKKQYYRAFQHLAITLCSDQGDYFSLLNLEALTFELGMYETGRNLSELIERVEEKYGIKQHSDVHFFNKGNILLKNKDYRNAVIEFEKCLHSNPSNEEYALRLIRCYRFLGMHEKILSLVENFISNKYKTKTNLLYILSVIPQDLIQKNIKHYISIIENTHDDKEGAETLRFFSLARFYHMDENYSKAWTTISKVNDIVKKNIKDEYLKDRLWEKDFLDWARDTEFHVPAVRDDEPETIPLYMLGPSRSGKSSLEKAIDWLPGVKLGFENSLLSNATSQAFNAGDRLPCNFMPFLPEPLLPEFVTFYRSSFRENTQGANLFTTTTPGLITGVPAIMYALPKAKFIFMERNPQDTALRMYFQNYRNANYHSYDIEWSLGHIKWYYELVEIWRKKFPAAVIMVKYENLVSKPIEVLSRVLDFLEIKTEIPSELKIPDDRGFSDPYCQFINKKRG